SFTVAYYPNKRFAAELTKVAFGSTKSTTDNVITYTAYLKVQNPELELRPGMTATATIQTAHRADALLVPNTALRFKPQSVAAGRNSITAMMGPPHRSGGNKSAKDVTLNQTERAQTVYVVGPDGKAQPKEVTTGLTNGRMTEVLSSDFAEGTKVITDQLKSAQ
ncbi:MAG: efflux RND transporter periplasmic adaptor subunit, partial [Sutterellaceae bacterium]|nr:efflux RND transporter periplasmic adaptor subunit [Sutterellaceae bacterium]